MVSAKGLCCKRCGGSDFARNGVVRGHQRYRCRTCGCHFTDTPLRGKPPAMKALAVLLYGMGGMSFSMIGRVLGVSDVAVLKWVRAEAAALPEPEVSSSVVTVEVDEMWHFIKKSLPSSGSGVPMTWINGEPWPGCWVGVMMLPVAGSSTRSA
ncbi:MAG: IS1/IS1595 family N-terminal zinc-binding domain-containing protein [Janthinobacterium lividum]